MERLHQEDTAQFFFWPSHLKLLHKLALTLGYSLICSYHVSFSLTLLHTHTYKHTHSRAHTNLVFGRGAAAVLGQVQHGSVALKAGRAVEPVLMNQPHAHTDTHTHKFGLLYLCRTEMYQFLMSKP